MHEKAASVGNTSGDLWSWVQLSVYIVNACWRAELFEAYLGGT